MDAVVVCRPVRAVVGRASVRVAIVVPAVDVVAIEQVVVVEIDRDEVIHEPVRQDVRVHHLGDNLVQHVLRELLRTVDSEMVQVSSVLVSQARV